VETIRLGVIMNGVTGRMGTNQHLVRSIAAIRAQGGVALADGRRVLPDPMLVGRNAAKLEALARANGVGRWTTDLDAALANRDDTLYFDAASTGLRPQLIAKAIAAGKHIYTEKPVAPTLVQALELFACPRLQAQHGSRTSCGCRSAQMRRALSEPLSSAASCGPAVIRPLAPEAASGAPLPSWNMSEDGGHHADMLYHGATCSTPCERWD
jgi:hypothetical protein